MLPAEMKLRVAPEFVKAIKGALIPPAPAVNVELDCNVRLSAAAVSELPPLKLIALPPLMSISLIDSGKNVFPTFQFTLLSACNVAVEKVSVVGFVCAIFRSPAE